MKHIVSCYVYVSHKLLNAIMQSPNPILPLLCCIISGEDVLEIRTETRLKLSFDCLGIFPCQCGPLTHNWFRCWVKGEKLNRLLLLLDPLPLQLLAFELSIFECWCMSTYSILTLTDRASSLNARSSQPKSCKFLGSSSKMLLVPRLLW